MLAFMSDVTRILSAIEQGNPHAVEELLPLVYDELRKLAALQMAHDRPGETLNPTALVHEAYLRLVGEGNERRYHDNEDCPPGGEIPLARVLLPSRIEVFGLPRVLRRAL